MREPPPNSDVAVATARSRYWWFEEKPPGTIEGYALIVFSTLSAIWTITVVGLGLGGSLVLTTIYAMPLMLVIGLAFIVQLVRVGGSRVPIVPAALGVAFIAGGAALDVYATVAHSPTLDREGNPVARALLDSGHSLAWVYNFAFLAQSLLVTSACLLWIALLRHRDQIVAAVGPQRGFWPFLKAATGGGPLTWREWLFPLRMSEVPHPYHVFWIFVVAFVGGAADRWFVALDWYALVDPRLRWWILGGAMTASVVAYFAWLWRATGARWCEGSRV